MVMIAAVDDEDDEHNDEAAEHEAMHRIELVNSILEGVVVMLVSSLCSALDGVSREARCRARSDIEYNSM
jgi:hypothetical protein